MTWGVWLQQLGSFFLRTKKKFHCKHAVAKQKESAAASVPKNAAHVAEERKRTDVALHLALTSDKIDELRRQLQKQESALRAAQTELDATDKCIEVHVREAAELFLRY